MNRVFLSYPHLNGSGRVEEEKEMGGRVHICGGNYYCFKLSVVCCKLH